MQWSPLGAHHLLQTRTAVLNRELRSHFDEWYPEMGAGASDDEDGTSMKQPAQISLFFVPYISLLSPILNTCYANYK